jgi:hypothetical protein
MDYLWHATGSSGGSWVFSKASNGAIVSYLAFSRVTGDLNAFCPMAGSAGSLLGVMVNYFTSFAWRL